MPENKKFYQEINIARGIGILLVVLGHSFPDAQLGIYNNSFWYRYIFKTIYSFHMPLFFMMSGFVSYKLIELSTNKEEIIAVKNKFLRLMIPYLVISIPSLILKYIFSNLAYNKLDENSIIDIFVGINPNGGLWFLYSLFVVSLIAIFIKKKQFRFITVLFLIIYFMPTDNIEMFTINEICKKGIFYFLGMFIYENYDRVKIIISNKIVIISSALLLFIGNYKIIAYKLENNVLNFIITVAGIALILFVSNIVII
jgi:fucose 4-O-acetylase-like acetyltransferase